MYTHVKDVKTAGIAVENAKSALIMIHGRGASAQSMIPLSNYLHKKDFVIFAPQASKHSWYPTSFIAPVAENQPALDSALELIADVVKDIVAAGIPREEIYFLGFSQGACLTVEYVTRNAARYGGVIAFTGGIIGEAIDLQNYNGDFEGTKILITTGDPDHHVPLKRVEETSALMKEMNASVKTIVYPGKQHTITDEEIDQANDTFFN